MPFSCEKTLTLISGSPVLEINEAITNQAEETVHCVWGQHIALGAPFLSEDCVIDVPGGTLTNHDEDHHPNNRLKAGAEGPWPLTEGKDGSRVDLSKIPPKSARFYDLSYLSEMPDGWYAVTNQKKGVGWGVVFPKDVFRYLWFWQSIGGGYGYPWWGRTYNGRPRALHEPQQRRPGGRGQERHRPRSRSRRACRSNHEGCRLHGHRTRRTHQRRRLAGPSKLDILSPAPMEKLH